MPVDTSLDPATRPPPPLDLNDPSVRKAMIASAVGNVLEWFDFGVFAFLSPQIGKLFFPSSDRFVSTLNAYVVFGGGFIFRPLGGIVLAHIGTVHGRKTALLVSVVGMAGATATMGCLPTYHDVGPLAPVRLSILRLIQGLSVGGEFVGSIVFAVESRPPHRQVLGGALCMSGAVAGLTLGSATGLILHAIFTPEQVLRFGWRIPFWCGLFIGIFALWLRREVHEPGGGADGGDAAGLAEAVPSGETATHTGPGVGEVCVRVTTETDRGRETEAETHRGWPHRGPGVCEICVRDKQGELSQLFSNLRGGAQTFRDIQSLSVGSCMMQMSLSPKGRAVHEHGQHRHEMERNARSWAHAGRFQGMDTAQAHAGENMVTHTSYPSGSSLGGGTGVAEFSPLARRQRCTTQRLQEKNATQTQTPSSRGGYQPTGGGFGAHKPVGPQCKFLPIMLGSLRGADSSSSES